MQALSKAIDEIHMRIPRQILDVVFNPRVNGWKHAPVSIDEYIMSQVIRPRVLIDCNLVGGTEDLISLEGLQRDTIDTYTYIYRIPKSVTQGRSIQSVLNVTFTDASRMSGYYGGGMANQYSTMLQTGSAVMDAMGSIPMTSTAKVQLIGENVVMVRDSVILPSNLFLRCVLANDENLSHLQLKSYRPFAMLCVLAVKAHIFNEYFIQMDMGELHGGVNLGTFKTTIEGWADSQELYDKFLEEKWQKISFMNDTESYTRLLKITIGGSR